MSGGIMKKIIILLSLLFFMVDKVSVLAKEYVIGGGDVLQISVWGSPELSLSVTVRPDGKISMPAVGEIMASGLTPVELKHVLENELTHIIKKPIVTVIVTEMTNSQVIVFGRGVTSGIHILHKETTLLQFLVQIGATLQNADLDRSYLMRDNHKIKVGFSALFIKGELEHDIILEPNDILFIPDSFDNRIKVVGAVRTPLTITYKDGLTIIDAILAAGGFTEFAKKNDVLVIRNTEGQEQRRSIRVKDLMNGELNENIKLMPGDFIVVKESFF